MDDKELYAELTSIMKSKALWERNIDYVSTFIIGYSVKITAKALWILGEMGLLYPDKTASYINSISLYLKSDNALLRERSVNALGRMGRANYNLIKPYWNEIMNLSNDNCPSVRLAFIWANENIAQNSPQVYKDYIEIFAKLLDDKDNRVRIEAPEMFRVLGKRKPEYVSKYIEKLKYLMENDTEKVVRIHAKGAIKSITDNL